MAQESPSELTPPYSPPHYPRQQINARLREWRKKNPDKVRAQFRRWYRKHREKSLARTMVWRSKNHERYNAYLKEWQRKHRAELKQNRHGLGVQHGQGVAL